ncbi:rotatin-like isoform X2 [Ornithodoros turicata]|uniref:rotatin-like isoform X2 n=1 Tax=Ornithodoros turicata TaxID=34597 RepID=UPI003139C612
MSHLIQCYCPDTQLDTKALSDLADPKCDSGVSTLHVGGSVAITESIHGSHGICTASLLGSVCRLLQNLVILYPEQATSEIRNHQLHLLFLRYILGEPSLSTKHTIWALHEIIKLITQCALKNGHIRTQLLQCSGLFIIIFICLRKISSGLSRNLYTEVWKLISVLLELEGVKAYEVILMCITLHWNHVREWLANFLDAIDSSEQHGAFFTVLCQLCTHDYKPESILSDQVCFTNLLDTALSPLEPHTECLEQNKVALSTAGGHIATLLTKMLSRSSSFVRHEKNLELELLIATLSSVLSISQAAKDSPSHAQLLKLLISDVTCLCDAIKQCKTKQMEVQAASKSTDIAYPLEQRFELLQNAVFQSSVSKEFCCSHGLLLVILQSWWFITGKTSLLISSLKLLLNLTADCVTACQSITRVCTIPGGMTLSHHLVQLAQQKMKEMSKGKEMISHLVFGVLCNLSVADDFRKFLSKCITLLSDPDIKKWQLQEQQSMWLKMMITLTSSAEGQKLVATTKGALTLLCEWATPHETISHDVLWNSMLVLRNLCFLHASKGKLLATGKFLKSLQLQLDANPSGKQRLIVGSTLWALLANYEKAKALTHANKLLCTKIYEVYRIVRHGDGDCCRQTAHVFQSVIGILERQS